MGRGGLSPSVQQHNYILTQEKKEKKEEETVEQHEYDIRRISYVLVLVARMKPHVSVTFI